jgi:hypothetical protein
MHARFLNDLALVADAGQISNQQDAQQKLGVNQRPTGLAIAILQLLAHETEVDVHIDQPQQVALSKLVFKSEAVELRFETGVWTHHEQ